MLQWLRLWAFTAEGPHSIPGGRTKISQAQSKAKKEKEFSQLLKDTYQLDNQFYLPANIMSKTIN